MTPATMARPGTAPPAAGLSFSIAPGWGDGPLAGLSEADRAALEAQWAEEDAADERLAGDPPGGPEVIKAGFFDRTEGDGCGFAAGGAADTLAPGPVLAGLADRAWDSGLPTLSDDELIGVLRAARRLASRAAALEYAAAADLMRRRLAGEAAGDARVAEHAVDEIAAALRLTGRSADRLLSVAMTLEGLPATRAALAAGDIDPAKAGVIADETAALGAGHRAAVEQQVLARALHQTTGELRAATRRAVIAADPAAARCRKEAAQKDARVERWDEDAGTAALAGRDLSPASVLAADQNLSGLARSLKAAGVPGTMDSLRALVFLTLLAGQPVSSLIPPDATAPPSGSPRPPGEPGGGSQLSGVAPAGLAGAAGPGQPPGGITVPAGITAPGGITAPAGINLTLPLATWLGASEAPGSAGGAGPLDAADSRSLAAALAARAGTTWCLTLTDPAGRPLAHGCAAPHPPSRKSRRGPGATRRPGAARAGPPPAGRAWTFIITPLAGQPCAHRYEARGYQPSPKLRHLLETRHTTCAYPGCRRPARRCDHDHTIPYASGGRTCECVMAPLCRWHHQAKQAPGWRLEQPCPGTLIWTTPSGREYTTHSTQYPE